MYMLQTEIQRNQVKRNIDEEKKKKKDSIYTVGGSLVPIPT